MDQDEMAILIKGLRAVLSKVALPLRFCSKLISSIVISM